MTDVVADVKDAVEVSEKEVAEKEVEKSELKDEVVKKTETENGDAVEEKLKNGTGGTDKSVTNGDVKENGITDKAESESESKDSTDGVEVCGIKRKSEAGLESDDTSVESSEKKQKKDESVEPEVAANGDC